LEPKNCFQERIASAEGNEVDHPFERQPIGYEPKDRRCEGAHPENKIWGKTYTKVAETRQKKPRTSTIIKESSFLKRKSLGGGGEDPERKLMGKRGTRREVKRHP